LDIALQVARRATCLRRKYGAIIVKDDQIISTGYCGSPRGAINCLDIGKCPRQEAGIPSGQRYELCRSVHAEANAIIHASRQDMLGSTLYLACLDSGSDDELYGPTPCRMCARMIINAGIDRVITRVSETRTIELGFDWLVKED
jgi:dCMP deaminase